MSEKVEARLLTTAEVAELFRVRPQTVLRWVREGRLTPAPALGQHRRFREAEVRALLAGRGGNS